MTASHQCAKDVWRGTILFLMFPFFIISRAFEGYKAVYIKRRRSLCILHPVLCSGTEVRTTSCHRTSVTVILSHELSLHEPVCCVRDRACPCPCQPPCLRFYFSFVLYIHYHIALCPIATRNSNMV